MLLGAITVDVDVSVANLVAVHAVAFLLAAAIAGYSTLASCVSLDPGRSLAAAGILTAFSYFANVLGSAIEGIGWLKYASLFYYYDSLQVLADGAVNWTGVAVYVAVFAVTVAASVVVFRRRDLVR